MGCNCKNKNNEVKKQDLPQQEMADVKQVALQTIEEMEQALNNMSQDVESKVKIQKFMMDTFGEAVGNYCDTICRKRLLNRLNKLKTEIK